MSFLDGRKLTLGGITTAKGYKPVVPLDMEGFQQLVDDSFDEADIPEVVDEEEYCPLCNGKNCDGTCEVANCESE